MADPILDLTNPAVVEQLKQVDVLQDRPSNEDTALAIEHKIRGLRSASTFKLKLTADQLIKLERDASAAGYPDWHAYLQLLIDTKIFQGQIGAPLISKPSFAKATVSGPSLWNS
ncbi:hypothetical protein [Vulcanococcus sp.]|jgi:hypothetical protein|uniref:hypothetical protein n=1 Tax=Vulcanococcus sp. TaxID=2856995 RepID=UPI0037D99382